MKKQFIFPKRLQSDYKSFIFLIYLDIVVKKFRSVDIYFNFEGTEILNTSHLAIFMYIVEGIIARNNHLTSKIASEEVENIEVINKLYEHYVSEKIQFIVPVKLSYCNHNSEIWLENLKLMNLCEYNKIKIMISELIANLKMHTKNQEGTMAGYIDKLKQLLIISIVNNDLSIKKNLESEHMDFSSDFDAVMWALKRTHTTRNSDDSGGLGLYLLRKYLSELKGQCIIVSGNCFMILDEKCFNVDDENRIEYKRYEKMPHYYEGNIFNLMLPLKVNTERRNPENDVRINEINLGEIYGLFD